MNNIYFIFLSFFNFLKCRQIRLENPYLTSKLAKEVHRTVNDLIIKKHEKSEQILLNYGSKTENRGFCYQRTLISSNRNLISYHHQKTEAVEKKQSRNKESFQESCLITAKRDG